MPIREKVERKRLALLLLIALISLESRAQSSDGRVLFLPPQGNVPGTLSGEGFGGATRVVLPDLAGGNPATLTSLRRAGLGVSTQYSSVVEEAWITGSYRRPFNWRPQSAGFLYPLGSWRLGLGYAQAFSAQTFVVFDEVKIRDDDDPRGYVEVGEKEVLLNTTRLEKLAPVVAFTKRGVAAGRDALSIGVRVGASRLRYEQHRNFDTSDPSLEEDLYGWGWTAGARYGIEGAGERLFSAGLFYQSQVRMEGTGPVVERLSLFEEGSVEEREYPAFQATWPARFGLGLSGQPTSRLTVWGEVQRVSWQQVRGADPWREVEGYKNQLEFAIGTRYDVASALTGSLSFYQAGRNYVTGIPSAFDFEDDMVARFLAAGMVLRLTRFQVDLVLAEGHLFSSPKNRQTLVKTSISVYF